MSVQRAVDMICSSDREQRFALGTSCCTFAPASLGAVRPQIPC